MTAAIEIEGLTKRFGRLLAVDDLSLDVPIGSVFGFLGANGAGKTTTIRTIAGLARPTSGTVRVLGLSADAGAAYRRQIGYLSQEPAFYQWMTARDVLLYAAGFHSGIESPRRRADELLALVGLSAAARRRVAGFSGGMRQRLGVAAALVGRPAVLVLDEPASGLDPIGRKDVLELIETLRGTTTVFYSTHILDDVQRVSDRVAVLDHGRLVATDTTDNLLSAFSRNTLRVTLLGADAQAATLLTAIPEVVAVVPGDRTDTTQLFSLQLTGPEAVGRVQHAITALASIQGFAVVEARPLVLDLEEVFLRLVGDAQETREVAA